ncbi:hypothetical protein RvY_01128 [Ramazzottius varieornatus]|uniref:C2H2-type domain-containing protein n=1 Tax=Ramazzottius varieornatus TaxID=947166 RepID=A0A1D1UPY1_RAMVA|nr:hypothetical protein RvY_01128 [Ramazzottius varieornatus]
MHSNSAVAYPTDTFGTEDPHRQYEATPVVYNSYLDQRDGYYGSQTSEEKQYVSRAAAEMLLSLKQITFPEEASRHQPHGYVQGAQYEHRQEPYEYIPHYPQVQPVSVNFQMTMSCISGVASVPSHYNRPPTVNPATSKPLEPPKRKPHSNGHNHARPHSALQYHRVSSHYDAGPGSGEKVNICTVCQKSYARPSTLKTHMRTHSGEKPYMCHLCPKTFTQAANLTAHGRTHSGEKPFRCPVCERRFSQSSSVTTHMRTHSGERPYRCRVCKKAFSDSSTLTKHIRIHSGEKPYQCHLCMLRFSQSGNLNRHMKVHLAERHN